ncbi:MAG TPA: GNAT family protein, partial [Polyangia bacterium]|nr:GNAT family protein [Polyangia bacterium]
MADLNVTPVILEGARVRLEPLAEAHHAALCAVGLVEDLWRWSPKPLLTPADMTAYIAFALAEQAAGRALPFVTVDRPSGRIVGSTRFGNIDKANRRVEIGWTWLAPELQRTGANTEAKYLMLRHAFETLGCLRVELKTDALNARSRAAIARIGAREEGTLRRHMLTASGRVRDTVYYSVVDEEWPAVKAELERRLS